MENYFKKYKNFDFNRRLSSITEISHIRFQKILHMFQNALFMAVLGLTIGKFFNNLFPKLDESKSKLHIILESILQLFTVLLIIYYLIKIVNVVPFLFVFGDYSLNRKSGDGENSIKMATTVAIALVFNATQINLKDKILFLSQSV